MTLQDWWYGPWRYIEVWRPPVQGSGYYTWSRMYAEGPARMKDQVVTDKRFNLMDKYWDQFPVVQVWTWEDDKWKATG